MSDKNRIVDLDVDLDCYRCKKKIREVLSKYQEEWGIKTIIYDDKNNKVTLSGPFDPEKLVRKLCCKACRVIRKWCIKKPEKPKQDDTQQPTSESESTKEPGSTPEAPISKKPGENLVPTNPTPKLPTFYPYPCPYPYPYPYPYPLPKFGGGCLGKKPCSCGGCRCGCRPCGCGCRGGCSGPYRPPTCMEYAGPYPGFVCEELPADRCILM